MLTSWLRLLGTFDAAPILAAGVSHVSSFPLPFQNCHEVSRGGGQGEGSSGRVYINATQYFEGVEPEVWEFHIGGYQVAEKWLKDRKGRTLSYADIEHYQRTLAVLDETGYLMERVDEAIEEHGGWPLA